MMIFYSDALTTPIRMNDVADGGGGDDDDVRSRCITMILMQITNPVANDVR